MVSAPSSNRLNLIPIAILVLGILNAVFAHIRYEQQFEQELSKQFRSDANTRFLVGQTIVDRYQAKTRSALATFESNSLFGEADTNEVGRLIGMALSAADLMSADTPFSTMVLTRDRSEGSVMAFTLPPRFSALSGVNLSADEALKHIDWSVPTARAVTTIFNSGSLADSALALEGVVVLTHRLLGRPNSTSQFLALSVLELEALQRAIDRELSRIGTPPALSVYAFDAATGDCVLAYEVNEGSGVCPEKLPSSSLASVTEVFGFRVFLQPTDTYLSDVSRGRTTFPYREAFWMLFLSLASLLGLIAFNRFQTQSEERLAVVSHLFKSQERVTGTIHTQVSAALIQLSKFADTLRDVADDEDQRYVDIAITDIIRTRLELDGTVLASSGSSELLCEVHDGWALRDLIDSSAAYLNALTKDGHLVTRLLADDSLPVHFSSNAYWLESLVFALIQLSVDNTDEGLIELAFWSESDPTGASVLYVRTRDTGLGLAAFDHEVPANTDILRSLVSFLGADLVERTNSDGQGSERVVKVREAV